MNSNLGMCSWYMFVLYVFIMVVGYLGVGTGLGASCL